MFGTVSGGPRRRPARRAPSVRTSPVFGGPFERCPPPGVGRHGPVPLLPGGVAVAHHEQDVAQIEPGSGVGVVGGQQAGQHVPGASILFLGDVGQGRPAHGGHVPAVSGQHVRVKVRRAVVIFLQVVNTSKVVHGRQHARVQGEGLLESFGRQGVLPADQVPTPLPVTLLGFLARFQVDGRRRLGSGGHCRGRRRRFAAGGCVLGGRGRVSAGRRFPRRDRHRAEQALDHVPAAVAYDELQRHLAGGAGRHGPIVAAGVRHVGCDLVPLLVDRGLPGQSDRPAVEVIVVGSPA